jgi:hypothetical protein
LSYADIPLPFSEMHTEAFTSNNLIRAAISPARQLTGRLVFALLALLVVLVLSEISKLKLQQYLRSSGLLTSALPREFS